MCITKNGSCFSFTPDSAFTSLIRAWHISSALNAYLSNRNNNDLSNILVFLSVVDNKMKKV